MAIHIITGPPASGKTTYVHQHRKPGDVTIDYDELANALGGLAPANHQHDQHIKTITQAARKAAIDAALKHTNGHDTWIIHSIPSPATLESYRARGAEIHTIDPGKDVVMKRCKKHRPPHMLKIAANWYNKQARGTETTTKRGYGHSHQKQRRVMLAQLVDGSPCEECGRPMFKNASKNFDGAALEADHGPGSALKYAVDKQRVRATRLLHRTCNRRGGAWDRPKKPQFKASNSEPPAIAW